MEVLIWTLVSFVSGAIPYSVLVGKWAGKVDIRTVGDHNPGATNVLRALDKRWFALAFLLDTLKGAVPVGLAWFVVQLPGWGILPVALAPVAGHAFSPFLGFKGGKAVAVSFGVWIGLTAGVAPTLLGLTLGVIFLIIATSGWAVILTLLVFGGFLWGYYVPQFPVFAGIWAGHLLLLGWKHRQDLASLPRLRPALPRQLAQLLHKKP